MSFIRPLPIALSLVLLAGSLLGCAQEQEARPFPHAVLTPAPRKELPHASFMASGAKPFSLQGLKGDWVWLYFGFANCPDVCPTALEYLASEYKLIEKTEHLKVVFVSVDPMRDTPEKMATFTSYYHPDFIGVSGEKAGIDALAKAVGAGYVIDKPAKPGGPYNVSHTNMIFAIDPDGRFAAGYVPGVNPGDMARDFDALLKK